MFPGHQGGPHNHAISAMAASLKMAQAETFRGVSAARGGQCERDSGRAQGARVGVEVVANGGHCVGIRGLCDADVLSEVVQQVNMRVLCDGFAREVRLSSNAMSMRGMDAAL